MESGKWKVESEGMGVSRFEELIAWQKAKVLCIEVYKVFEHSKDFGFKDQIQRASVSIMNNIAEGSSIKRKVIKFESISVDTPDSKDLQVFPSP